MATSYLSIKSSEIMPRLPLEGNIDLTYRCNNSCRHCWLCLSKNASEKDSELTFGEIRRIADEARALGTREWRISGGEPMLRADFLEIFDYLTRKAIMYSLNTNGTYITPKIAQLLKRRGSKLISLYGATAKTYAHITRNPEGFEQTMRGFRYMEEANADFTIQLIPMRDNWHEWEDMVAMAKSLGHKYRIGATWLHKTANNNKARNNEIEHQRLLPHEAILLDLPDIPSSENLQSEICINKDNNDLFASCISVRRSFHIDPYGKMTFCGYIKDPAMRYDLQQGTVQDAWDNFIPSLSKKVMGGLEYSEHCGSCDFRKDCSWCAVYGFLEHGRYSAPVEYLCEIALEKKKFISERR